MMLKVRKQLELQENGICLTDKCAQLLGVKARRYYKIKRHDNKEIEAKISNIVENYVSHYIYMSKATYENLYGEKL